MLILAEMTPLDPVSGSRVTLRASSSEDRTVTGLNSVRWIPAISGSQLPSLSMPLFNGDLEETSDVAPGFASFSVQIDALAILDANARRFNWQGASVELYAGNSGQAWPWTQVFDGRVSRFSAKANTVGITAEVNLDPFRKPILTAVYAGTGGAEGDANIKSKPKPLLVGRCHNVEPVLINAVDSVFQVSAYGPINAVNALYERGSDFGATFGDYASYAALVAAAIPAGRWGTCLALGLIRLGAPPYGVITADVEGDKPSTWLSKSGEIINRLASIAGVAGGNIDSASLTAIDSAVSTLTSGGGIIGYYFTAQTEVLEAAKIIAQPLNAVAGVSFLGKLFVARIVVGSPTLTLDAQGRRLPAVIAANEDTVSPPFKRIEFGARRSWRVHNYDEISSNVPLVDKGDYDAATTYREGNIVNLSDGTRYEFINTTPSAGHVPPNATYWAILSDPPVVDFVTQVDGGGKPDPYAGLADNLIVNAALLLGYDQWSFVGAVARTSGGSNAPSEFYLRFPPTSGVEVDAYPNNGARMPLDGASKMYFSGYAYEETGASGSFELAFDWYNSSGSSLGTPTYISIDPSAAGAWQYFLKEITVPANAVSVAAYIRGNFTTAYRYLAAPRFAKTEPAADVTLLVTGTKTVQVAFDYLGVVKSGQLPMDANFKLISGGTTDLTTSASWSATLKNGTATFTPTVGTPNTTGTLNVTALSVDAVIEMKATYQGKERVATLTLVRNIDAPPVGGGGGGGTSASTSTIAQSTSSSYGAANTGILSVVAGAAGQVACSFPDAFQRTTNGTGTAAGKWQWRVVSGSWADITSEITSTTSAVKTGAPEPSDEAGEMAVSMTKTGLTNGTTYEFQLLLRSGGSYTLNHFGTASAVGS